jgi:hypothetical protein
MSNIASLAVVTGALIFSDPSIVISSREEYSEVNNSQFFYTEADDALDGVGFHIRSNEGQTATGTVTQRIDFAFSEQQIIEQINTHLLLDFLDVNDYVSNIDPTYKYNYDIKIYNKIEDSYIEIFSENYIIQNSVDGSKSFDEYIQINQITTSNIRVEVIHNYKMYDFDQIDNMLSEIEIFPEKLDNIALGTNITVTSEGDVYSVKNPEYLVDENMMQACRVTFSRKKAPTYEMSGLFFADVELTEEITINRAQFVVSFFSGATYGSGASTIYRLQYWNGSEWLNIINEVVDMSAEESEFKTEFRAFAVDDINITTSKIRIAIYASSVGLFNAPAILAIIHEIMLFSTQRQEFGLVKIYTQTMACSQLESNPIRFKIGNEIYGIPLVATNDANASAVRTFDRTSVKALKKIDT